MESTIEANNTNGKQVKGCEKDNATNNELFKFLNFPVIEADLIIPTQSFFDACRSLIEFITILGPVFIPVRSDIGGNVDKLTKIVSTDHSKFTTINSIIEMETCLPIDKQIGTDALLWLTRALQYMNQFLTLLVADYENGSTSNDLTKHFTKAYDTTLRKYHNWIVQNLVHLSLKAAPSRNCLIKLLAPEINESGIIDREKEANLYQEMSDYRKLVEINIEAIHQLYDNLKIDY